MILKLLPLVLIGVGGFLGTQLALPYLAFKVWELTTYNQHIALLNPTPKNQAVLGISVENSGQFPAIISSRKRVALPPYQEFRISIPSIELKNLVVKVESNRFDTNLAHLPGTALPGEKGNVFLTGHSSLPQLYKPTDYKTIFTNLPQVRKRDVINIEAGGQIFRYIVQALRVVDPKDISVTQAPDPNGRYLSLMTCVPPGYYTKRLIVLAELR